jgi:4-alpha-glucanotransferase
MEILREIYGANKKDIGKSAAKGGTLAKWIDGNPWIRPYAVYRRLKELNGEKSWKEWDVWPDAFRGNPSPADIETLWNDPTLREEHLFWAWLQEALDTQFHAASEELAKMGVALEGDIPILMNEDCADSWAHPQIFNQALSAGAPPDMYDARGQNWGFPTYNWDVQEKDGFSWWKARVRTAERYYQAYRIDHVLGFFRIWASSRRDKSDNSVLGRYVPYLPITAKELKDALKFSPERIRWVSRPHVPTGEVWDAVREAAGNDGMNEADVGAACNKAFALVLDRIGSEELWLFKNTIAGEKDIEALDLYHGAKEYLIKAWRNRMFLEYENGAFFPTWFYHDSRAWASLNKEEQAAAEKLIVSHLADSEKVWEKEGEKLLKVLQDASPMLPCAEDLGAVPACVPRTLAKLKILGLRVVRWNRAWDKAGQPYEPFEDYPELTVCTPAVHDSSCLREWWEKEADQDHFASFIGVPSLPKIYNPGTAKIILYKIATAASRFRVFQIQDLLHLSNRWYAEDPASERVNVPGTDNDFNWSYRLPATIAEIAGDEALVEAVKGLAAVQPAAKQAEAAKKPVVKAKKV